MRDASTVSERIISASASVPAQAAPAGVELYTFVSKECSALGFSTGIAKFQPSACLPYHTHTFSEAITVLEGQARVLVEGRAYQLEPRECIHVPAGTAHSVESPKSDKLLVHWAFAVAEPGRDFVHGNFPVEERGTGLPSSADPETVVRCNESNVYELAPNAFFCDLFARRFGAIGICGGYGRFLPGSSLPCHVHDFDESITIVEGSASCLVKGKRYQLSGYDTAFVPTGRPHRFVNDTDEVMAMIWVYAGSEPDRRMVESGYCSGELTWPEPKT